MQLKCFIIVAHVLLSAASAAFAPNYFLGTCLTNEWVASMEAQLGISSSARDSNGRLIYPFLQPALQYPRFTVRC